MAAGTTVFEKQWAGQFERGKVSFGESKGRNTYNGEQQSDF